MTWKAIVISIVLLSFRTIAAQQDETFEGFMHGLRVNAAKGEVVYQRDEAKFPLEPGLKLEKGDFIKTAPDAYAELLLQPGNFLRVAGDTEIQIVNDEHDRMRLKLNRGAVIVEVLSKENLGSFFSSYEARYLIRVLTPEAPVFMGEPGVFRITSGGQTELVVRNGSAVIKGQQVKAKRRAVVSKENVTITEIAAKNEDSFDAWARERAESLVRTNKALKKSPIWTRKQKEEQEPSIDVAEEEGPGSSPLIVSAKPGTVNFADDGVEFSHTPNEWQPLTEKTNLQTGDHVRTGATSFAELELFPDMYLRLATSSEAVFEQLSNDAVSVKIVSGSAILDVARFDRKKAAQITIANASTSTTIADSGNYRIDVHAITVRDGKVTLRERTVGECHTIMGDAVSECDKKRDDFDYWSHYRGEGEYANGFSMASYVAKVRRTRFRITGFWFQLPGETSYTFVPFTSEMYRSPYGGNYSTALVPRRRLSRPNNREVFRPRAPGVITKSP